MQSADGERSSGTAAPALRRSENQFLNVIYNAAAPLGSLVLFVIVWEVSAILFAIPPYLLPSPTAIWQGLVEQWSRMVSNTWVTLYIMVAGYVLSVVVSIPLALLITFSRVVRATLYPAIVALQIIPKIAIAPLFMVWFGFGFIPKIMLVFLISFFPIILSSISGFRSLDKDTNELARSTGATPLRMFTKIRLPHALPYIFTGLKVGAVMAATAAVVAEFVGSDAGLGYLILEYNGVIDTPKVFAAIGLLSGIGLVLYFFVELLEKLLIPWHQSRNVE